MIIETALAIGLLGGHSAAPDSPTVGQTSSSSSAPGYLSDPSVQFDTYQFEEAPGSAPISLNWGGRTRDSWGSSYAYSSELFQLFYTGRAKAAGNIYQNLRIVQVCIWYTRASAPVTSTVCSFASSDTGYWASGPEVSVSVMDSLDLNGPHTIFNIQTARINPNII